MQPITPAPEVNQDQETPEKSHKVLIALVAVAVLALAAWAGYVYAANSAKNDKATLNATIEESKKSATELQAKVDTLSKKSAATSDAAPSTTDKDEITAVLTAGCNVKVATKSSLNKVTVSYISGNFAQGTYLCGGDPEGPEVILKKSGDTWTVVWTGLGEVDANTRSMYAIPSNLPK